LQRRLILARGKRTFLVTCKRHTLRIALVVLVHGDGRIRFAVFVIDTLSDET
jgi:hypothetical protein